ncbi:unnamed protein product [Pocillopora meandrina]|uniref:Uncharacterized protein n=1 Tax=Pocillopora meandrina TaxID=46732 RepID=A0AAU9WC12_9CNID|nr:unnamed protein product [Pocillopora meandrina]
MSQNTREVAGRAHKCLQKLQGAKGSELDKEENSRFSGSSLGPTLLPEATESNGPHPILKLTGNEDDFLKQGREIFEFVQWTAILGELN